MSESKTMDFVRKYYIKKHLPPDIAGGIIGGIGIVCSIFLAFSKDEVRLIPNLLTISLLSALVCWLSVWLVIAIIDSLTWAIHTSLAQSFILPVRGFFKAINKLLISAEKGINSLLVMFLILMIILAILSFLFSTQVGEWILGIFILLIALSFL